MNEDTIGEMAADLAKLAYHVNCHITPHINAGKPKETIACPECRVILQLEKSS